MKLELIISKNEEDCEEIIEGYNKLPEKVKEIITQTVIDELNWMVGRAESCDSPIEQILGIALEKRLEKVMPFYTNDFFINTQDEFEIKGKKYRVDFFIAVKYKDSFHGFIVECDGHEFHKKTKEQAKNDKKRDRDLLLKGHPVIRFTGSEIIENPYICAREVTDIIIEHIKE